MSELINSTFMYALSMLMLCGGIGLQGVAYRHKPQQGAAIATLCVWMALAINALHLVGIEWFANSTESWGLRFDGLSLIMNTLIFFVSAIVHQFSRRYMAGDRHYQPYFTMLSLITLTASLMVCADNIVLMWSAWTLSNLLLVMLMVHKPQWQAAKNAGVLAFKTLACGSLSLLMALLLFYQATGSLSIDAMLHDPSVNGSPLVPMALVLFMLTGLIQSAQWPFHQWLTSSLNSPTPVSALMHAGLINGGGFILVKFAPLLLLAPGLLFIIFLLGALTAMLGTAWKLVQSDIKRLLACSTMAQMGFMMMQCGLGLFPAAIAHLCWHGLFKAFLFLNAGSVVKTKRIEKIGGVDMPAFLLASFVGVLGAYCFATVSEKSIFTWKTTTFLVGFAFISGTQCAYTLLEHQKTVWRVLCVCLGVTLAGVFYGESIYWVESLLPMGLTLDAIELSHLNMLVFALFLVLWLFMNLHALGSWSSTKAWSAVYMNALNASQPHSSTVTASRKTYQF